MKTYKCVIFDIDGTILDTERMNMIPLQRLIKQELGHDVTYDEILKYRAYPGKKVIEELGFEDIEASYALWVKGVNSFEEKAGFYDGILDVIQELAARGITCCVSSSKLHPQYLIDFAEHPIDQYMTRVVLAEDTLKHKPDPEPLLKAIEGLEFAPEDCIYIGDMDGDGVASRAAGMAFGFALWGAPIVEGIKADYYLEHPEDILALV